MDEYAVIINAGSSSLKFSVFRRRDVDAWRLEVRGQVEGIGTRPQFSAKDEAGRPVADHQVDAAVKDGRAALAHVADWLRERYGGARVRGIGHRVVHGGARYTGPTR